jgi:dipeptidyl aminopeptidase/acylaminoacyl peptidase
MTTCTKMVKHVLLFTMFVILTVANSSKAGDSSVGYAPHTAKLAKWYAEICIPYTGIGQDIQAPNLAQDSPQERLPGSRRVEGYYKGRVTPHWFADNKCFWYRNDLRGNSVEFILVNAEQGTRQPAFDHQKLAAALSKAAGVECQGERLPFDNIEFLNDAKTIRFAVEQTTWTCDLASYTCTKMDATQTQSSQAQDQQRPQFGRRGRGMDPEREPSPDSPDGKWTAFVKDNNVFICAKDNGQEMQLSTDGVEGNAYGVLSWAPDSKTLLAYRIEPSDNKEVYLIESSPAGGGRAKLHSHPYTLPGDKFATYELNLFDVQTQKQIKPDVDRLELDWQVPRLHWKRVPASRGPKDQRHFAYEKVDRGHQRFRVIEVDSHTGQTRNLIDETRQTFIWTAHTENLMLRLVNWLDQEDEIIYVSERDGWRHLYLIDAKEGKIKNQITSGEWVVRGIDLIDEDARQIWFSASGKNPNQDPYLIHYYRVNFDGSDPVALTEGNGTHSIQYSPDRRYLIDTYSRVDMAPVHELRRVSDGKLVCPLEKADITELIADGWTAPEVFVDKGRDGKTDIWGIICRPCDFDPGKRYPVIEQIYAGPQGSFVPKSFSPVRRFASLTDLGFIVVQIDGMGTANRSKAFHDVCWKNLKDAGFPDRILWHQAVAKKYPYYDISRVGIYGNSAGGQSAAGALLFHPEFYKAAVASCGCHDNRMDKASWNEQWMGYPVGPQYAECSNVENAQRLRGKLFLIVGEMDNNVPPESTMRFVDALIKAGKDIDLLVIPGAGHGMGGSYGQRRLQDFFVRHLLGIEPPDRNAEDRGINKSG